MSKHLVPFLLGTAAVYGAYKYLNMTEEEKERLAANVKDKANKLKTSVMEAEDQAMDYFNELKSKGADVMQEYMPKIEEFVEGLFKSGTKATNSTTTDTPPVT